MTDLIILGGLFLTAVFYLFFRRREEKNFPKGPRSYLPLIGGFIWLGRDVPKALKNLGKKWGGIFAYDLGPKRVLVINDYKAYREAGLKIVFSERNHSEAFVYKTANETPNQGIIFSQGKAHVENRKYSLKTLRKFGFGTMENIIHEEVQKLIQTFKERKGVALKITLELQGACFAGLWSIVTGQNVQQDDPTLCEFFERLTADVEVMGILIFFPWIFKLYQWIPWLLRPIQKYIENCRLVMKFMKDQVDDHKNSHHSGSERDFIDQYLTKIKNETNPESIFFGKRGENNLITICHDMFLAGTEPLSTTLSWILHLLSIHPDIQDKVFEEVKCVIGNRSPRLTDRSSMPYTECTIMECQRFGSTLPMVYSVVSEDVKNFHGFDFPKGLATIFNLYAVLNDEKYWGDPETLRPERFLTKEMGIVKHEPFIPFSYGRRYCLGDTYAKDSLFLFTTNLIQKFKIFPDPSKPIPKEIKYQASLSRKPISFPLVFQERDN